MQDRAFRHTDRSAIEARIGVAEIPEALPVACSTGGCYSCHCRGGRGFLRRSAPGSAVREQAVSAASSGAGAPGGVVRELEAGGISSV